MNERNNEQKNKRTQELLNQWMHDKNNTNGWANTRKDAWMNERKTNEWMKEKPNERFNKC